MFNKDWGGLPAKKFLVKIDPKLYELQDRLYEETYTVDTPVGNLSEEWVKNSDFQQE